MGFFSHRITDETMAHLCRRFAATAGAGIPLVESLSRVAKRSKGGLERDVFERIAVRLEDGQTLSGALRQESRHLPAVFIDMLIAAEFSGRIEDTFGDLADCFEERTAVKKKIAALLVYPALQITAAWLFGTFAFQIISRVEKLAAGELSGFSLGEVAGKYLAFQMCSLAVAAAVLVLLTVMTRMGVLRRLWARISCSVWPLSSITKGFALGRFFRHFSLLLGSGIRVDRCLKLAAPASGNPYIGDDLMRAAHQLRDGKTVVEAFSQCRSLDRTAREMLSAGEVSGKLEWQMKKAGDYYLQGAVHRLTVCVKVLNITLALLIGVIIAVFVVSCYVKLYTGLSALLSD